MGRFGNRDCDGRIDGGERLSFWEPLPSGVESWGEFGQRIKHALGLERAETWESDGGVWGCGPHRN